MEYNLKSFAKEHAISIENKEDNLTGIKETNNNCKRWSSSRNTLFEKEEGIKARNAKDHISKLGREGPYLDGSPSVQYLIDESGPPEWVDQELHLAGIKFFESYRLAIYIAGLFNFFLSTPHRPLKAAVLRTGAIHNNGKGLITRITRVFEAIVNWVSDADSRAQGKTAQYTFKTWRTHRGWAENLRRLPMPPLPQISERDRFEMAAIQNDIKKCVHAQNNKLPEELTTYDPPKFITQLDHTVIMFGLFGIILTCPTVVGIPSNYCRFGHKGFLHSWYITGKRLGITDEYNLGLMSPEHGKEILRQITIPSWAHIDEYNMEIYSSFRAKDYLNHPITLVVIVFKRLLYRTAVRICLQNIFQIEMKEFKAFLKWYDYLAYYSLMTFFGVYRRFSWLRWCINTSVQIATPTVIKILYFLGE